MNNNDKFEVFIGRWISATVIIWVMTYFGFVIINGDFNLNNWNNIQRGNLGGFLVFFSVLTGIITAISVADKD